MLVEFFTQQVLINAFMFIKLNKLSGWFVFIQSDVLISDFIAKVFQVILHDGLKLVSDDRNSIVVIFWIYFRYYWNDWVHQLFYIGLGTVKNNFKLFHNWNTSLPDHLISFKWKENDQVVYHIKQLLKHEIIRELN